MLVGHCFSYTGFDKPEPAGLKNAPPRVFFEVKRDQGILILMKQ